MGDTADARRASVAHLLSLLDALRLRVEATVGHRRTLDPSLDDAFLGLYLSDETIDRMLAGAWESVACPPAVARRAEAEAAADAAESRGHVSRLRRLVRGLELDELDVDLLIVALAPDVDERFERFYGYLNDDVTRRRATIGLALHLTGQPSASTIGRDRLSHGSRLVRSGLIEMEEMGRPFLTRGLAVPDRVVGHLLGSDLPDAALASIIRPGQPVAASGVELVVAGLRADVGVIYLRQEPSAGAAELAVEACRRLDRDAVILDLDLVSTADDLAELVPAALREAALRQAVVVAGPIDHLVDDAGRPLRLLADADPPVVLTGTVSWDPGLAGRAPMFLDVGPPDEDQRAALWAENLQPTDGLDAMAETAQFRLTPLQIASAATAAAEAARAEGRTIEGADLRTGARLQNAARLERLARRIEPAVGWDDLVLPPALVRALHRLADRARHRAQVLGEWRMRPGGGRGAGVTALLSGDPGTGKTMSAEVVAGDLGLDLYVVNLATVVDKYVGETEKNLDRIFTEAAGVNGVLLFDEADALFGQRSEVRDSHDRYANLEVAYLLQRMEAFDGLALLATNLRANIDEAFARRLDAILDFPNPDAGLRRRLWEKCLATVPAAPDLDLDYCAEAFDLAGGNVRSIAITAAYRAAAGSRQVTMPDLVASIGDEYRKLGRLCLEAEFGPYHHLASS